MSRSPLLKETIERLNPKSQAVKSLEMAARRGLAFAALHARHLELCGNPVLAGARKPEMWDARIKKLASEVWRKEYWSEPTYLEYEWCFQYWLNGGHDRGLQALLDQLPAENRKRVIKTMEEY